MKPKHSMEEAMKLSWAWMSNPQYLAQVGHFFGAYAVVFTVGVLWPHAFWPTVYIGLALAGLKEFVFDTASWGEGDSFADSAMDFLFYALGAVLGIGVYALLVVP